jgi:hypothetical protein
MEAGTAVGGTGVGGMEAIGIVGVGGPTTAGVGGVGAVGIPTRLGVNILTVIMVVATAGRPAPKTKPQRFNRGLPISVSITARSTAKSVQGQKVPSKLSKPSTV